VADSSVELPYLPPPPSGLLEAADGGRLVLFVGAGVSRLAGSPGWEGFANAILDWLVSKGSINHSVRTQLTTLPPRTRISIAKNLARAQTSKPSVEPTDADYRRMLMSDDIAKRKIGSELYRNLTSMSKYYVTTNYDLWLDERYPEIRLNEEAAQSMQPSTPRARACVPNDFKITNMEEGRVIHLHGSLAEPSSMILSTSDYLTHYRSDFDSDQNPVTAFLRQLFEKGSWAVLFVGYGMDEMEILEYVLHKSNVVKRRTDPSGPRHYLLRGFYSHEANLVPHLADYYKTHCGVELVPYCQDKADHMQLASVISDWAKRVQARSLPPLDKRREFERLLDG